MSHVIHLRQSRSRFVYEASQLADVVEREAEQLSAATEGALGRETANEMRALAERITRLDAAAARAPGDTKRAVHAALQAIRAIRAGAKALDDKVVDAQLTATKPGGRGVAQVLADLDVHLALFAAHAELRPMFPADVDARFAQVRSDLVECPREVRKAVEERGRLREELREAEGRLTVLVARVRAVRKALVRAMAMAVIRGTQ